MTAGALLYCIGTRAMQWIGDRAWGVGYNNLPLWNEWMPQGAPPLKPPPPPPPPAAAAAPASQAAGPARRKTVVYLPSCVTRMMGPSKGDEAAAGASAPDKFFSLLQKAGYAARSPSTYHLGASHL